MEMGKTLRMDMGLCAAITKAGKKCPIGTDGKEFCHVHDSALQCGVIKRNGEACTSATGGRGPCPAHKKGSVRSLYRKPRGRSRMTLEEMADVLNTR